MILDESKKTYRRRVKRFIILSIITAFGLYILIKARINSYVAQTNPYEFGYAYQNNLINDPIGVYVETNKMPTLICWNDNGDGYYFVESYTGSIYVIRGTVDEINDIKAEIRENGSVRIKGGICDFKHVYKTNSYISHTYANADERFKGKCLDVGGGPDQFFKILFGCIVFGYSFLFLLFTGLGIRASKKEMKELLDFEKEVNGESQKGAASVEAAVCSGNVASVDTAVCNVNATNAKATENDKKDEILKVGSSFNDQIYVKDNKLYFNDYDEIDTFIERIKKATEKNTICIETFEKEDIALTDSKFGGYPYWPYDMEYPVNSEGKKLFLLAQINMSDVHDDRLPENGLLQFFVDSDILHGLKDPKGYKVVYHDYINPFITEKSVRERGIRSVSEADPASEEYLPLENCLGLRFKEGKDYITCECASFEKVVADTLKDVYGIDTDSVDLDYDITLYKSDDGTECHLYDDFEGDYGHRLFGYPLLYDKDPRENGDKDILLFQMDSDYEKIRWGVMGAGQFFISEENLERRDFDKVFYFWDYKAS